MNIGESQDVLGIVRTLGAPGTTDPDRTTEALARLVARAGKQLGVVPDQDILLTAGTRLRSLALGDPGHDTLSERRALRARPTRRNEQSQ